MSVQVQGPHPRPITTEEAAPPGADGHAAEGATTTRPVSPPSAPPSGPGVGPTPETSRFTPPNAGDAAAPAPAARRRPGFLNRRVLLPIGAVILLVVALLAFNAWRDSVLYVSTDNAQLSGQPVQVGSMNAGKVDAIMPNIGDAVHKGDVVAQVALPSQTGMAQSGQPKLGFLGAGDTHVDVQAPIDGVVIAEPVAVGSEVAAGAPIVSVVAPTQMYVTANIEETNIARVKVGQPVTVHIDALGTDVPGKVEAVTPATAVVFSILPSQNTSGNFTKVTQLVPVRISVNLGNQPTLLGANVEVKIKVAD